MLEGELKHQVVVAEVSEQFENGFRKSSCRSRHIEDGRFVKSRGSVQWDDRCHIRVMHDVLRVGFVDDVPEKEKAQFASIFLQVS